MDKFKLEILTPNGEIFDGEVISVTLPGEEGEFGVLAGHASLTTLLTSGVIDVEKEDKSVEAIVINWGVVQVDEGKVIILVEGAAAIRGADEAEIAEALEEAKKLISDVADSSSAIASVSAKIESAAQRLI
ncbi:MAG TPA: F0F1 ATP synthase subunit epsilon [Sulfurimonas sp.]|uniref:ATP synthase epsilon chain n=1 Tax=hydrothermal vent metagenome TaxID=652676 RepID=A0A1W1CK72_9ZZZZ|nr:MAG: ATP synthase epsilon chain [uncultured Sulfurimonas sp.]CAI6156246.1 MAG: ATP synthase epsilon chain [uncultured Sulfurimonas sp.]HIC12627.1 F0F1 ATP synthase subunit epsilon [Sulfurimonas sp.]HIM75669.1 F0F1 ATP synthase subunit epsilon [Campylobacterales bacterium]